MNWMLLPLKRYADFKGRSRRMEFWMFNLMNVIVYVLIAAIVFGVGGGLEAMMQVADPADPLSVYGALFGGFGLLFVVWALATLVPAIAVTVRRLHDRDMSGWWYLGLALAGLIPFIGFIASIALLVLMFLPGTEGDNRFGPDPKDSSPADVFS